MPRSGTPSMVPNTTDQTVNVVLDRAAAKLLARKRRLLNRLMENPGPQERAKAEGVLAQINATLNALE
jgi:hypothetical protein